MGTPVVDNEDVAAQRSTAGRPGIQMLRVEAKEALSDGVLKLRLVRPDGGRVPFWTPGGHLEINVPGEGDETFPRHYSLCGDRWDGYAYEVAVLRDPRSRGGSARIHDRLEVGDVITAGSPRNNFILAQAKRFEFIAGGIGITPILSMIRAADQLGVDWHLNYGGRTRASMAFLDELSQYGDRVTIWPEDEVGLMDLSHLSEPVEDGRVYCCGPEPLLNAVQRAADAWPDWAVRFERFVPKTPAPPARTTPFEVELARSGRTLTVDTDTSVLSALTDAGVSVLSSCNEGVCGTCEVAVLCGQPDHRDSLLNDSERAANDRMFVCVSRSVSDRLTLDL